MTLQVADSEEKKVAKTTLNLPEDFHAKMKAEAARRRISLTQAVIEALAMWSGHEPEPVEFSPLEVDLRDKLVTVLRASNLSETFEDARELIIHHIELLEKAVRKS